MRIWIIKKRTLIIGALAALLLIAALVLVLVLAARPAPAAESASMAVLEEYERVVVPAKERALPVYAVERADKRIALTVDAAWEADKTDFILDTLKKYDIKATFFLCGVWVHAYPEQVKSIYNQGHEIGNHSLTHPHMNTLSAKDVQAEIAKLDDEIEAITGSRCTLFRAPYGEYNDTVIKAVREIGYEPIQWNIDTMGRGWKTKDSFPL